MPCTAAASASSAMKFLVQPSETKSHESSLSVIGHAFQLGPLCISSKYVLFPLIVIFRLMDVCLGLLHGTGGLQTKDLDVKFPELISTPRATLIDTQYEISEAPSYDIAAIFVDSLEGRPIVLVRDLARRERDRSIQRVLASPVPSSISTSPAALIRTSPNPIGRPSLRLATSDVTIYSPLAAQLFDLLHNPLVPLIIDSDVYGHVTKLFEVSAQAYPNEDARANAIVPIIEDLVGVKLERKYSIPIQGKRGRILFDAAEVTTLSDGRTQAVSVCFEFKKGPGSSGSGDIQLVDGYQQMVAQDLYRDIRDQTDCSSILVSIAGPNIAVFYAAFGDVVMRRPILPYLALNASAVEERCENIATLAKVVQALRNTRRELRDLYERLPLPPAEPQAPPLPFLPNPVLPSGHSDPGFPSDLEFVDRFTGDVSRSLFFGRRANGRTVAVEFSRSYNRAAHDTLADANLAPKLDWVGPIAGGLTMAVMFVDESTMLAADRWPYYRRTLPAKVRSEVRRAVDVLHEEGRGQVHGNVRPENILVSKDDPENGPIQLIGFGSPGPVTGYYPLDLSMDPLRSTMPGARAGGPTTAAHDIWMCDNL
ncbi:hypothetical protein LXA43DRAFT_1092431 [Ganoderma leucocontextum]|nr:hypothetical protein LXA43DRAFT_1092431 [Ganoderma leucocontextum]